MPIPLIAAIAIVAVLLLAALYTFNHLVRLKQDVKESWADIDTELKRRYDLIPNLVETVKGYAGHEHQTLEAVIPARPGRNRKRPHRRPAKSLRRRRAIPRSQSQSKFPAAPAAVDRHRNPHQP